MGKASSRLVRIFWSSRRSSSRLVAGWTQIFEPIGIATTWELGVRKNGYIAQEDVQVKVQVSESSFFQTQPVRKYGLEQNLPIC